MKAIPALGLLVALSLVVTGCGMGKKKVVSPSITVTGTTTIPNVKVGTLIGCRGGADANAPARGDSVAAGVDQLRTAGTAPATEIQLTREKDGSVVASCGSPAGEIARVREVTVARSSNRRFSIFPPVPGKKKCSIPDGAFGTKPIPGTCRTTIRRRQTHEPSVAVIFTEEWLSPLCPRGGDCVAARTRRHHTWQVVEGEPIVRSGAKLHVYATRSSGATAPQDYK